MPPCYFSTIPPVKYSKENKHKPKKERGRHSPKQNSFEVDGTPNHYIINKSFKLLIQMNMIHEMIQSFGLLFDVILKCLEDV